MATACVPPDPVNDFQRYLALTDATGKRSLDMGNYYACLDAGNRYCLLSAGGKPIGACVPSECSTADVANMTSPIFVDYISLQAPIVPYAASLTGSYSAKCNDDSGDAFPLGPESQAVITFFSVAVLGVLLATLCVLARRRPTHHKRYSAAGAETTDSIHSSEGERGDARTGRTNAWAKIGSDLVQSASLTRTLQAVLGGGQARLAPHSSNGTAKSREGGERDSRSADLSSFNGVRVLSISLVILGHSLLYMRDASELFTRDERGYACAKWVENDGACLA